MDSEPMAGVRLKIGAISLNPGVLSEQQLHGLNQAVGKNIIENGCGLAGTSRTLKRMKFRLALSNWHTNEQAVEEVASGMGDLGQRLL